MQVRGIFAVVKDKKKYLLIAKQNKFMAEKTEAKISARYYFEKLLERMQRGV
jgi:hypothetical protein